MHLLCSILKKSCGSMPSAISEAGFSICDFFFFGTSDDRAAIRVSPNVPTYLPPQISKVFYVTFSLEFFFFHFLTYSLDGILIFLQYFKLLESDTLKKTFCVVRSIPIFLAAAITRIWNGFYRKRPSR